MKKKLFTLLTLLLCLCSGAWGAIGDTYTVTFNGSDAQTTAGYFTFSSTHNFNSKFTGAAYDNVTYTSALKMEGSTEIYWTAEAEHTVIILQSDWESKTTTHGTPKTNKLDGTEIPLNSATTGTGYYLYTIEKVAAGTHTISRGSGENGLFMVRVVYTGESQTVVALPTITWNSSTNKASIKCATAGATIYYTTDGSVPTASSSVYSADIPLANSTTVRAIAIKNEVSSAIAKADCYVDHSSVNGFIAKLGLSGGSLNNDQNVWTSTDNSFKLTNNVEGRTIAYANIAGSQDGFKLNHTDSYTLKISDNVKLTKIVVVGKTWLNGNAGNASTIAFDGFTPASGSFFDYVDETYVNTIEFTPETELGYGASITMRPGNNQLGAYIEIYGEEYTKTSTSTTYETTTWDFTNWSDATKTGVKGDETNWNQYEKADNDGLNFGENGRSLTISRGNNSLSYGDPGTKIAETDGLKFTCGAFGLGLMFNLPSATISSTEYSYHGSQYIWLYSKDSKISIENVTKGSIIEIGVESHNGSDVRTVSLNNATQTQGATSGNAAKAYQVCKWEVTKAGTITITPSKGLHIYYIKLDKASESEVVKFTPALDKTTYVTTKALDFSNVNGLKAYAATAAAGGKVTLGEVGAVPAGTPLMLIGTADTEYTVPVAASATAPATNLLRAGDGTTTFGGTSFDYILYSDGKFYQIGEGTVATTKAYLHCETDPTAAAGVRGLSIVFASETTGIGASLMNNEEKLKSGEVYDLQGRKVANPTKGLYIVDGKKVIIN